MEKYKRQEVSPVEEENERDETYAASNPRIDKTRTHLNYHLIRPRDGYIDFINSRIATLNLKRKVRSDAIYMNSIVLGASPDFLKALSPQEEREFFSDCTKFCADKYGKENIISAVVHKDESTPHLHLNFVPIVDGKLSSKELFDRKKLSILQTEFFNTVGNKWGLKRGKEGSTATHITAAEYTAKQIIKEAEDYAKKIDDATSVKSVELLDIQDSIAERRLEEETARKNIKELSAKKETLEKEVADIAEIHAVVTAEVNKPIPMFGKADEIKALRATNALLKKENAKKDKTIAIAHEDNRGLFEELKAEQKARKISDLKADINRNAALEAEDIKSVFPNEYAELLRRAQDIKSAAKKKSNQNSRTK